MYCENPLSINRDWFVDHQPPPVPRTHMSYYPVPPKFPLEISSKTLECLTSAEQRPMPGAKPATVYQFAMVKSECGRFLSFVHPDGGFAIRVVLPTLDYPEGLVVTSFFGDGWSNFRACAGGAMSTINGGAFDAKCGEQMFKAAAVVAQMDPLDDESPRAVLLFQVLEAVMSATKPRDCKFACYQIPEDVFDSKTWDEQSKYVMEAVQYWKCLQPCFHALMKQSGEIAVANGVKRLYFVEAAGSGPHDLLWGCGLTVAEFDDAMVQNHCSPQWQALGQEGLALPFSGKNLLGEVLTRVSERVLGKHFEFIGETVEQFTARIGTDCVLFKYTPPPSIIDVLVGRTGSDDAGEAGDTACIGRTGSDDAGDVADPESVHSPKRARVSPKPTAPEGHMIM